MTAFLSTHWHFAWLITASFVAGVMNAMAGGGSFLSFPAMLSMGVLPIQANATNTVALWPGQLTSLAKLRGDLRRDVLPVVISTAILGGVGGAIILLHTHQRTFLHILPWLLLMATLIFGVSGRISRWIYSRAADSSSERSPALLPLFFVLLPACFYIGYFGAGGGFLIMSALSLFGVEQMHQLNSIKVLVACLANLSAVVTFIFGGAIVWHYCLLAMVFAALGGWIGAHYARRMNGEVLRMVVVITGLVVSAYFFWRQG